MHRPLTACQPAGHISGAWLQSRRLVPGGLLHDTGRDGVGGTLHCSSIRSSRGQARALPSFPRLSTGSGAVREGLRD